MQYLMVTRKSKNVKRACFDGPSADLVQALAVAAFAALVLQKGTSFFRGFDSMNSFVG